MLSLTSISIAQVASYYEKDDYYTRSGGIWQGELALQKGLEGEVRKPDFDAFVKENQEEYQKRAGFDLCFSVPKSVSLAFIDPGWREEILEAHREAVTETLSLIEERAIQARVTSNRETRKEFTGNMVCGKFDHFVSRNQDIQLHTHCVIFNKTLCADGLERAIDYKDICRDKMLYGQSYRNTLARNLIERGFGLEVTNKDQGFFELAGVSREQIERHSSRRLEIESKLDELKAELEKKGYNEAQIREVWAKSSEKAALLTRKAKEEQDMELLFVSISHTVREQGIQIEKVAVQPEVGLMRELALKHAETKIARSTFAFTKKEFVMTALKEGLEYGLTLDEVETYFQNNLNREIFSLGYVQHREYFCTKLGYETEQAVFQYVENGKGQVRGIRKSDVESFLENTGTTLKDGQKAAVLHICGSSDRFAAVQGLAGTGKTHMLNIARQIIEKDGYEVKGVGYTGKAAEELKKGAQIDSCTIHAHLNQLEKEAGHFDIQQNQEEKTEWNLQGLKADKKEIWIVDEASLVDNQVMKQLMEAALRKDAKMILIGDRWQMQPVGAGSAFSTMIRDNLIHYVEMNEIVRQKSNTLKYAVEQSAVGDLEKSLQMVAKTTRQIQDREVRLSRMAHDFTQLSARKREKAILVTATNRDRRELNELVRGNLKKKGELKYGETLSTRSGVKEFAVGDRIIFLKNNRELGVQNGQTGKVAGFENGELQVQSEERIIHVDTREYNEFDYGYVLTTHKAQGMTVDTVLVHIDTNQKALNSRNSFYVDISRARKKVHLYTNDKETLQEAIREFHTKISSRDFREMPALLKNATSYELPSEVVENLKLLSGLDREEVMIEDIRQQLQSFDPKKYGCQYRVIELKDHPQVGAAFNESAMQSRIETLAKLNGFADGKDLIGKTLPQVVEASDMGTLNHYLLSFPEQNEVLVWEANTGTPITAAKFENIDQTRNFLKRYDPQGVITSETLCCFYQKQGLMKSRGGMAFS